MAEILKLSEESFQREVIQSEQPVLVEFYSSVVRPCKMLDPLVKQLADGVVRQSEGSQAGCG